MGIEASVIIDFGEGSDEEPSGTISVEFDEEHPNNLDSDGNLKSSFAPEEQPVFIIHHDNTLAIIDVKCTDGRVDKLLGVKDLIVRERSVDCVFPKVDTKVGLSYYGVNDLDETWYGNIGKIVLDGMNVLVRVGIFPCYCTAIFNASFVEQWQLTPPPLDLEEDETYTIYVVVYVKAQSPWTK